MVYQNKSRKAQTINDLLKILDHARRQGYDSSRLANDIYDHLIDKLLSEQRDHFERLEFLRADDVPH